MPPARVVGLLLLAGCAHPTLPRPDGTLRAYAAAVARDDPHTAWQLLAGPVRARVSEERFAEEWRASVAERTAQAELVKQAASRGRVTEAASLRGDNWSVPLVRDPPGWRLASPRRSPLGAATPEEAVRRFAAALEEHNVDAILQLLADPLKTVVERELADRLARARGVVGKPVTVEGDHARVHFDQRYHIDLIRENGQWRIADFN
jgi:hypothetical protein